MRNLVFKTFLLLAFVMVSFLGKAQPCELTIDNFSSCAVNVTVLNSTLTAIVAFGTPAVAGLGGQYLWTPCGNPGDIPAFFQVDYGTCGSIIVDLTGTLFGPFTPGLCCPCGSITMSGISGASSCGVTSLIYHLDIQ